MESGWMMTLSSIWITSSERSNSRGVFFISKIVVKVMKFREPRSALVLFCVKKL